MVFSGKENFANLPNERNFGNLSNEQIGKAQCNRLKLAELKALFGRGEGSGDVVTFTRKQKSYFHVKLEKLFESV